jgi:hypothetical protein
MHSITATRFIYQTTNMIPAVQIGDFDLTKLCDIFEQSAKKRHFKTERKQTVIKSFQFLGHQQITAMSFPLLSGQQDSWMNLSLS